MYSWMDVGMSWIHCISKWKLPNTRCSGPGYAIYERRTRPVHKLRLPTLPTPFGDAKVPNSV